jgi:hypothetical protein
VKDEMQKDRLPVSEGGRGCSEKPNGSGKRNAEGLYVSEMRGLSPDKEAMTLKQAQAELREALDKREAAYWDLDALHDVCVAAENLLEHTLAHKSENIRKEHNAESAHNSSIDDELEYQAKLHAGPVDDGGYDKKAYESFMAGAACMRSMQRAPNESLPKCSATEIGWEGKLLRRAFDELAAIAQTCPHFATRALAERKVKALSNLIRENGAADAYGLTLTDSGVTGKDSK